MQISRYQVFRASIVCAVLVVLPATVQAQDARDFEKSRRAEWMYERKVGMSTHYVGSRGNLEERARQFKPEKVAEQVERAGAGWLLFTIHHQPWAMLAPNAAYDKLVDNSKYTAERDVAMELSKALADRGIKMMIYVNLRLDPRGACPAEVREAMGGWPPDDKLVENVAEVYGEFSRRYGDRVAGWWVDGAWLPEFKKSPHREKWFATIAKALRSGNPDAAIAFNQGLIDRHGMIRYSPQNDYTAGEMGDLEFVPEDRWVDGAQCQLWTYLGTHWSLSGLRFSDRELCDYARRVVKNGGALTFEVGTIGRTNRKSKPGSDPKSELGSIDPRQVEQVRTVVEAVRAVGSP